jgi:type VI secretion system protein ImpL
MSLSKIFGLMLLFFFFEAVVAVVVTFAYPNVSVFVACVAMTTLALGVWAVVAIVTRLLSRPRTPRPVTPKATAPARVVVAEDSFSMELGGLVAEANRRLAATLPVNQQGEVPSISNLPLYLVVGGEGTGKTSTILNSGIDPRLLAGEAARDGNVVPTRLCNLWYAEGAVFADFCGRVLTQESENWERALRVFSQPVRIPRWKRILLGAQSQQLNLKGVLLVCDASQFVKAGDPQRMAAFARTLGDRLQAAGSVLRREFPVYVVFSKCDAVQCFSEFFAHLSEPEGRRLLGATLPSQKVRHDTADIYSDREGKRLTEYFNRLYMSLAEKRLVFLAREDAPAKKSTAYEFPRELKKIRGDVVQFLLDVFRPNPLQAGPRLRGFYLSGQRWVARNTSPVSDGTMAGFTVMPRRADATVLFGSKPAQSPAMRPAGGSGMIAKWIFLTELFHDIILKDSAGNVAPRLNTRDQGFRNLAFAGVGALCLLLCLLWANSWRHNRELLNSVQQTVDSVHRYRTETTTAEALTDLDALHSPLVTLLDYDRHGPPISYRWGLYSGADATNALSGLYFDKLRALVLDPSTSSLTSLFLGLDSGTPVADDVYALLKTYRMVTSGECKPDSEFLGNTLLPIWLHAGAVLASDESVLATRQLQFYVSELVLHNPYQPPISENPAAVRAAQEYLGRFNGPDKLLGAIVQDINKNRAAEMLGTYAPSYVGVLSGPVTVEAAYTRDGWTAMMDGIQSHKLNSTGEACVVGKQSSGTGLTFTSENERRVQDLYVQNYIQRWRSFVSDHHVEPFHGASDGAQKLAILADNNRSPLLGLIYMTSHNTDLAPASVLPEQVSKKIEATKNTVGKVVTGLFGKNESSVEQAGLSVIDRAPGAVDIMQQFLPARVLVDPAIREKWINSANGLYVQALQELGSSLSTLPSKNDPKDPVNQQAFDKANKALAAATTAYNALGAMIPNTSSGVDLDLKALLKEPITFAGRVIASMPPPPPPPDMMIPIRKGVNQSAKALCDSLDALRTKYPFSSTATQEASLQDIAAVFAPQGGTLAQFAQSPDVQKVYQHQGTAWIPNPAIQGEFSQPFLATLNSLSGFQSALYPDPAGNPHFDYTVTLDGTGHLTFNLDIDGHALSFGHKKAVTSARLVWPPTTNQPTSLDVRAGQPLQQQESGLWGLFRVLQLADKQEGSLFVFSTIRLANGNQNPLRDSHGNPVQVQIHIDSAATNVFSKGYFGKLRCENFTGGALR